VPAQGRSTRWPASRVIAAERPPQVSGGGRVPVFWGAFAAKSRVSFDLRRSRSISEGLRISESCELSGLRPCGGVWLESCSFADDIEATPTNVASFAANGLKLIELHQVPDVATLALPLLLA
jgi:hypothetical protein